MNKTPILFALASAALFGLSAPASKLLLASVHPAVLAGILYSGAGVGIALLRRVQARRRLQAPEVAIGRRDLPWLAGAVLSGGVAGPLLLMIGLAQTQAATASLLLTFEGAATALIAWLAFREHYGVRLVLGMACLVGGAIVLAWSDTPTLDNLLGPLAILAAKAAAVLEQNIEGAVSRETLSRCWFITRKCLKC